MNGIRATLTSLPFAQFKRRPRFYLEYDAIYLALGLAIALVLPLLGYRAPVNEWSPWVLLLLPPATYLGIMAHVFIHNASHGNFPKAINRVVGELCGMVVLTKFASWEIVHRRHHRYSDDPTRDPHPAERSYWRYAWNTLVNVEMQLRQEYYDVHGDTPETRRYERWRSRLSFVSGMALVMAWFAVLGPVLFFTIFLPASLFAGLFVVFFNWAGHNAHTEDGGIEPTNIDSGIFWILNRMFFGIFYHGNHHRMAMLFNPMHVPAARAERESRDVEVAV